MDDAAERARDAGATVLGLAMDARNAPSIGLYESLGDQRHPALRSVGAREYWTRQL